MREWKGGAKKYLEHYNKNNRYTVGDTMKKILFLSVLAGSITCLVFCSDLSNEALNKEAHEVVVDILNKLTDKEKKSAHLLTQWLSKEQFTEMFTYFLQNSNTQENRDAQSFLKFQKEKITKQTTDKKGNK
jgi:hypothetical protein